MKHGSSLERNAWLFAVLLGAVAAGCSTSTGSGTGGATTSATTGGSGAGGGCNGDATSWAALTQGPIACTQNSDCCVIVNGCLSESQIVAAPKKDQAKAAWPYCDSMCNHCIPPAIEVGCSNGVCVGSVVPLPDASADLMMDHCGVNPPSGTPAGKLHFACGG